MATNDRSAADYEQLAAVQLRAGDARGAAENYQRCIALCPDNPGLHNNLGTALLHAGRTADAIANFRIAIGLSPTYVRPRVNLGMALRQTGQPAEAIRTLRRALELSPDYAPALVNMGNALLDSGDFKEAIDSLERAIQLQPELVEARVSLGAALARDGKIVDAIAALRDAVTLAPQNGEAHVALGHLLFISEDWQASWPHMEYRFATQIRPVHLNSPAGVERWDGTLSADLELWLLAEQGLGDTLQFSRYARVLVERGVRVVIACDPKLVRLLQSVDARIRVVAFPTQPTDRAARWYPLMSLPLLLGTDLTTVPSAIPYLASAQTRIERWQKDLGPHSTMRVGLAWAGNQAHANDRHRSIKLAELLPQLPIGFSYFSLQKDIPAQDREILLSDPRIVDVADELHDFCDTAALCDCLDLIISVDTSVAHLSGALGRNTWILLPLHCDWRWMQSRVDTPWYPTARLYRQIKHGDWQSLLEHIRKDLLHLLAENRGTGPSPDGRRFDGNEVGHALPHQL